MYSDNTLYLEDNDLLNGLKQGNRNTLTFIYKEIFPKVKYWIIQNGGQEDDAYDIFQEVMESILLNVNEVYRSFSGMVIHIAKNKWIDKVRKNKTQDKVRNTNIPRPQYSEDVEKELISKEKEYIKFKLLEDTFQQLSDTCQRVMSLVREGKKANEIANLLSFKSVNTLYRRKAACVERWSLLIKEHSNYKYCYE